MDERQKAELLREVQRLIDGRAMQVRLAESILRLARHANILTDLAIAEAAKGNFAESDPIIAEVMGYAKKVNEAHGAVDVYAGYQSRTDPPQRR